MYSYRNRTDLVQEAVAGVVVLVVDSAAKA